MTRGDRFRAVIAGAGVAGLEALLALREVAGEAVEIELVAPTESFELRPLLVAEPFGLELSTRLDLAPIVARAGARHTVDAVESVDPANRSVRTREGSEIRYDALLVAFGAQPVEAIPGALTYAGPDQRARFSDVLGALGHRGHQRLAFVVPPQATWTIAAYELALLTAAERAARRLAHVDLFVVTSEAAPLALLGAPASQLVAAKLAEAEVELRTASFAEAFADGALRIRGSDPLPLDHVVSLPALEVSRVDGLPQREAGFVETDVRMHVEGLEQVWAAGDVTSFPIKQGGLAAQQADVAARAIAARAGVHSPVAHFDPVLRAALITGNGLEFLRREHDEGAAGARALWWPPSKLAGAYVGPLLAEAAGEVADGPQVDLEPSLDPAGDEAERDAAIALVLAAADADAKAGDHESALRWLALLEQLNLVLPSEYVVKRSEWRQAIDPSRRPDAATRRIEPRYASAEAGISDLRRRLGWLREIERRGEGEMGARLSALDEGIERLRRLSRESGVDR